MRSISWEGDLCRQHISPMTSTGRCRLMETAHILASIAEQELPDHVQDCEGARVRIDWPKP